MNFKKELVSKISLLPKSVKVILTATLALVLTLGVSSANFSGNIEEATDHFSKLSVITEINKNSIEIETLNVSPVENLKINISYLEVIQTEEYDELEIDDLATGDQIIVQGLTDGEYYFAKRIISFTTEIEIVLDETATSTLDILNASSTATTTIDFENASSTDSENVSSTNATSTDEQSDESEGGSGGASSESSEETAATTTPENTTTETASSTEETSPEPDTEIPSEEVSAPPEDPTVSESTESATEPESLPTEEPTA